MYSYTATGIHAIHPPEPHQPKLRVICKCERTLIQEQIYTCLACSNYCCHFCTIPEIVSYQCRNCMTSVDSTKNNRCRMCFSCPYCSNVLTVSKDKDKKYIMLCQFCYWNSKEINVSEDKTEDLFQTLNKLSANIKESESKIYNASQGFFKEVLTIVDYERQITKQLTSSKKVFKKNQEDSLLDTKKQIQKTCENLVKRVGLDETAEEYEGETKIPQNLPLLAKKIRRCPCKKPLTTTFRNKNGDQKIQLMFKEVKMIQCQRLAPIQNKVSLKFLRPMLLNGEECKELSIQKVDVNTPFKVQTDIPNKTKGTTNKIEYNFIVLSD